MNPVGFEDDNVECGWVPTFVKGADEEQAAAEVII